MTNTDSLTIVNHIQCRFAHPQKGWNRMTTTVSLCLSWVCIFLSSREDGILAMAGHSVAETKKDLSHFHVFSSLFSSFDDSSARVRHCVVHIYEKESCPKWCQVWSDTEVSSYFSTHCSLNHWRAGLNNAWSLQGLQELTVQESNCGCTPVQTYVPSYCRLQCFYLIRFIYLIRLDLHLSRSLNVLICSCPAGSLVRQGTKGQTQILGQHFSQLLFNTIMYDFIPVLSEAKQKNLSAFFPVLQLIFFCPSKAGVSTNLWWKWELFKIRSKWPEPE